MWYNLPQDLRKVLNPDERVLWVGKPERAPFILGSSSVLFFLIPFFLFPLLLFPGFFSPMPADFYLFTVVFLLMWYGILLLMASAPLKRALEWRNRIYALTDRRAIVRRGIVGIDYDMLDLDLVRMVRVDVGFWDSRYGTGTITLEAVGVDPLSLISVKSPYDVQKIIERAIREVNEGSSRGR